MDCTHPVLYSRNCVLYCQVCGAVIPPKAEKLPEVAAEAATEAKTTKPRRTRKTKAD